jgi:hypothetical protein
MIRVQSSQPSTLSRVIRQVRDAFSDMGDATPICVGKAYLDRSIGSGPRVVFLPEVSGALTRPIELGHCASHKHGCSVVVRASESGDDLTRFDAVIALHDRVVACLQVAGTGRIEWGSDGDSSPTATDAYGAELTFSFTFRRDIPHDQVRWALPPADDTDDQGPFPQPPPGTPIEKWTITPTVTPKES